MTLRGPPESLGLEREIGTRKQVRDYAIRCAIRGFHEARTEIRAKTRRRCSRRERWRNHALSQCGLKRSRAPGANPLRNSCANWQVLDHKTRTTGVELDVFHQDPCEIGPPTLRAGARNPGATPSQSSGLSAWTSTPVWLPRRLDASPRRVTSRISTGDGGRVTCDQIFADHSGHGGAEFENRARVQRPHTAGSY